jgi:hypothetical protein
MSTPEAYTKAREYRRIAAKTQAERDAILDAKFRAQNQVLFDTICEALKPYHDQDLDGHRVRVETLPANMRALFFVDDHLWLTFEVERSFEVERFSDYGCDTPYWGHTESSRISLRVIQHYKNGKSYRGYFPCQKENLGDPDYFAASMTKMMDEYEFSGWK